MKMLRTVVISIVLFFSPRVLFAQEGYWNSSEDDIYNNNSRNVGIGFSTPGAKLHIVGTTSDSTTAALYISPSNETNILTVRNDRRVGIRTTTPGYELDVNGTLRVGNMSIFQNTVSFPSSGIWNSSGYVGMGTSNPGARLEISGGPAWMSNYLTSLKLNNLNAVQIMSNTTPFGLSGQADRKLHIFRRESDEGGPYAADILTIDSVGVTMLYGRLATGSGALNNATLNTYSANSTESNFKTDITKSGMNIQSSYASNSFGAGVFWSSTNNNTTRPKAGIFMKQGSGGSYLYFGTSNNYATGITNSAMIIDSVGNVNVNGNLKTKKVVVTQTGWADFVFDDDYNLLPLAELEKHIRIHRSLPDVPTRKEVEENGADVGDMQAKLLQKIEELTLYVVALHRRIEQLESNKHN